MATSFKIKGLKRWQKALNARGFDRSVRFHMRRATQLNGLLGSKVQRKVIQSGRGLKKNAALTAAIKGTNKPLTDYGDLFQSITHKVIDDFTVFTGLLRTDKSFDVGLALHEGYEVNVTKKMRGMFFILWQASIGKVPINKLDGRAKELFNRMNKGWLPLKQDTTLIVVPPRPWIKIAFNQPDMKRQAVKNWKMALDKAFSERARNK